jgi:fibronectin-binding autotransporter adhesin
VNNQTIANGLSSTLISKGTVLADNYTLGNGPVTVNAGGTLKVGKSYFQAPGLQATFATDNQAAADAAMASLSAWNAYMSTIPVTLKTTTVAASPTQHARLYFPDTGNNAALGYQNHFYDLGFGGSNPDPTLVAGTDVNNNFATSFAGEIKITQGGVYQFGTTSDDGSAIYIDGQLVVLNNIPQGMADQTNPNVHGGGPISAASISLTPGLHDITIAYEEGGGGFGLNVSYQGPDTATDNGAPNTASGGWVYIPNSVLSTTTKSSSAYGLSVTQLTGNGQADLNSGVLTIGATNLDSVFSGSILDSVGGGSLVKAGSGKLTLTGSSTYSGPTVINSGVLQLGDGATADGSLATSGITNNSKVAFDVFTHQTANYPISGPGSLLKTGPGTLVLGGNNTYTGGTTVNGGVLDVTSPTALLDGSSLSVGTGLSAFPGGAVAGGSAGGVSAVPEPGTFALLAALALCGLAIRRVRAGRKG